MMTKIEFFEKILNERSPIVLTHYNWHDPCKYYQNGKLSQVSSYVELGEACRAIDQLCRKMDYTYDDFELETVMPQRKLDVQAAVEEWKNLN